MYEFMLTSRLVGVRLYFGPIVIILIGFFWICVFTLHCLSNFIVNNLLQYLLHIALPAKSIKHQTYTRKAFVRTKNIFSGLGKNLFIVPLC